MSSNSNSRKNFKLKKDYGNFKIISGTQNKAKPLIIFIRMCTWATYNGNGKDYKRNIEELNSNIRNSTKCQLRNSKIFDSNFIYTNEIKRSFFIKKTNFHASFEFTLKQREPISLDFNEITKQIEAFCQESITNIETNYLFKFKKTKG